MNTDNPEVREFLMGVAEFWIREFDIDSQTSIDRLEATSVLLGEAKERTAALRDYIEPGDLVIAVGGICPVDPEREGGGVVEPVEAGAIRDPDLVVDAVQGQPRADRR